MRILNSDERLQTLYDLAEDHDIGVYFYDLGDGKAVTVTDAGFSAIALNPHAIGSVREETECLCHELGHLATGTVHRPGADAATVMRCEYRAASWVVHRMVPFEDLVEAIEYGCTEVWQLAEYFGVSEDLILDAVKVYRNKGML